MESEAPFVRGHATEAPIFSVPVIGQQELFKLDEASEAPENSAFLNSPEGIAYTILATHLPWQLGIHGRDENGNCKLAKAIADAIRSERNSVKDA